MKHVLLAVAAIFLMPTAFAKTNCNTGNGDCELSIKVMGQCKMMTVNISGATGDNCHEPGNNSVENIDFRCQLLGGKMDGMIMTKSMKLPEPKKADCAASDKIRMNAITELRKEHPGATEKAKDALLIEAGQKRALLEAGRGEAGGGAADGAK